MSDIFALFVGLGSIGHRHLKNLSAALEKRGLRLRADALRHAGGTLSEDIAGLVRRQYVRVGDLGHYDLAFICNPSQLHYRTMMDLAGKADRYFIEKPVFTDPLEETALADFADEHRYYVACPLRHTSVFGALKEYVATHPVYSARAICSSYLPEWRPSADYRSLYSAKAESHGVALDLIHDFDYLFSLFGIPSRGTMFCGRKSHLEIESPDAVAFAGEYPDKIVELHLDYFGRKVQRYVEIFSRDDTVRFDFANARVEYLRDGRLIDFGESRNDFQMREIESFLDFALDGGKNVNSVVFANSVISYVCRKGGLTS